MVFEYSCLALCTLGLALIVYRYDMYEREPWYMLLFALMLGMVGCFFISNVEDFLFSKWPEVYQEIHKRVVVVGVGEELIKLLPILGIAVILPSQFNDPMDGLIYGAFIGLGFGLEESIFYIGFDDTNVQLEKIAHVPVRLLLHLLFGALDGFGIGLIRLPKHRWIWPAVAVVCLGISITIHALWDYWLALHEAGGLPDAVLRITSVGLMGGLTFVFGLLVLLGVQWSRTVFAPKSLKPLWGWPFSLLMRNKDKS